jgi:ferredoxin
MTEPLAAALENEGHPTDVRCSWSCATCKQEGVNGVWAYAYETADETARRWTRWTLNACVRGCQFVAKAGEGREIS